MTSIKNFVELFYESITFSSVYSYYVAGMSDCRLGFYDRTFSNLCKMDGLAYNLGWHEQDRITKNHMFVLWVDIFMVVFRSVRHFLSPSFLVSKKNCMKTYLQDCFMVDVDCLRPISYSLYFQLSKNI